MFGNIPKEQQYIIIGLIALMLCGGGVVLYNRYFAPSDSNLLIEEPNEDGEQLLGQKKEALEIVVHIGGAVKKRGVYKLKEGARIIDVLSMAGGALPNADLDKTNLAQPLKDGEKVIIPISRVKISPNKTFSAPIISGQGDGLVNLNTADTKALSSLPGIGPSTARKIIDYRENNGSFGDISELKKVPGIGEGKFGKIKERITVY